MRPLQKIFAGIGLCSIVAGSFVAFAAPPPQAGKAQKVSKVFKMVRGVDHKKLIAKFRGEMADEIEATGEFKGKKNDTPVMHIVPTDGALIQTHPAAVEINAGDISGPGARFDFHGKKVPTKFKVLIPVSARNGLPYKDFAANNEYDVLVEDKAGKQILKTTVRSIGFGKQESAIAREDLVTEVELELPFDKSNEFRVSFAPTKKSKQGYTSGREVVVRQVP